MYLRDLAHYAALVNSQELLKEIFENKDYNHLIFDERSDAGEGIVHYAILNGSTKQLDWINTKSRYLFYKSNAYQTNAFQLAAWNG